MKFLLVEGSLSELLFPAGLPHCSWPLDKFLGWIKSVSPGEGKWNMRKVVGCTDVQRRAAAGLQTFSWLPTVPSPQPPSWGELRGP